MTFHLAIYTRMPVMKNKSVLDFDYQSNSQTLATEASAKYLGITIHKETSWDCHFNAITAKANETLRVPQMHPQDSPSSSSIP